MARFFTMLTFALLAATQTAQAFPHYTDFSGRLKATHDKSRNAVRRGPVSIDGNEVVEDFVRSEKAHAGRVTRNDLMTLGPVVAEKDAEFADTLESLIEMRVGQDVILDLVAIEAFDQGAGSRLFVDTVNASFEALLEMDVDADVAIGMMVNRLAIEAEKSAAWIGCRFRPETRGRPDRSPRSRARWCTPDKWRADRPRLEPVLCKQAGSRGGRCQVRSS